MNYTLHQLKIFLEVVRQKSITRAAREMHMTQPALSIQLKNFQKNFDIPLTELIGKQIHITEFGRSIALLADNVLREAEAIRYKTREYKGLYTGTLRISAAPSGKYVIPYFLSDFLREHGGIDLVLDVTSKAQVVRSLRNNEVDFALVSVMPAALSLEEEFLLENLLYLAGKSPKLNKDLPLIFREEGSATRSAMDRYFGQAGKRKRMELTTNDAIKHALLAGLGYSILPLIAMKNELLSGELRIIPSAGLPVTTQWRLVWHKQKKLSPVAEAYLAYIRENRSQILARHFEWYEKFQVS